MVATVSRKGYAATRVADLTSLSGVSSKAFYRHFPNKEACFEATLASVLAMIRPPKASRGTSWDGDVRRGAKAVAEFAVAQPAAAKMCLIAGYGAGPEALRLWDDAVGRAEISLERKTRDLQRSRSIPPELFTAGVGGLQEVTRTRLRDGRQTELPVLVEDLADLLASFEPPTEPLRLATRRPTPEPESLSSPDPADRILRALAITVAEEGFAGATVAQIVKRAGVSNSVFYGYFRNKTEATLAAIDSGVAQASAAVLPALRRCPDWATGVRAAIDALFNFLSSRPALAQLILVESFAIGPAALQFRDEAIGQLGDILAQGGHSTHSYSPVAFEAIAGGIYYLVARKLRGSGAAALPSLAPVSCYIALAPFIGADAATQLANSDGSTRPSRVSEPSPFLDEPLRLAIFNVTHRGGPVTAAAIARQVGEPERVVRRQLAELEKAGMVEQLTHEGKEQFTGRLRPMTVDEWGELPRRDRDQITTSIDQMISAEIQISMQSGYFDRRPEFVLVRDVLHLDQQGMREVSDLHVELLHKVWEVCSQSRIRLEDHGGEVINTRHVSLLFEMPP